MENEALVLDLVEWIATKPRLYSDVMSAWQSTCPRLTVWEDTIDARLVQRQGQTVQVTQQGLEFLRVHERLV